MVAFLSVWRGTRQRLTLCFLIAAGTAALVCHTSPASADIVQPSISETLTGGAHSNGYGGVGNTQTSTTFNSNLSFDYYFPGYQNSSSESIGSASWNNSSSGFQFTTSASGSVNPTPSFTTYNSQTSYNSAYVEDFQVDGPSQVQIVASQSIDNTSFGSIVTYGSVWDGPNELYNWNGNVTSPEIPLIAGDPLQIQYNVGYAAGGQSYQPEGTETVNFGSSLDAIVTAPEPSSTLLLGLGGIPILLQRGWKRR